jgi:tetratricopeptide (TPR) repeat protein
MGETLREGKFNCVSSTALTAMALEAAGISVRIEETPRHVLLYALQNQHWLRVETTSDERAIFRSSRKDEPWTRDITLRQLAGLQAYNAGLLALDQNNSARAYTCFLSAHHLYPDTRIREMLEHTAEKEARLALRLVRRHRLEEARPHLENALAQQPDDALLQKSLAAIILADIESCPDHAANLNQIELALARYASISHLKEIRQVHADLLLAVAWEDLENDRTSSGMAHLRIFERKYSGATDLVQADMAAEVYAMGWKALIRAGDEKGAEALLQRGLIFAPESATLGRKQDAMATAR